MGLRTVNLILQKELLPLQNYIALHSSQGKKACISLQNFSLIKISLLRIIPSKPDFIPTLYPGKIQFFILILFQ